MRRYAVQHQTRYGYGAPVNLGLHVLWLTPLSAGRQKLVEHRLTVEPEPAVRSAFTDHFGNVVHRLSVETTHDSFAVVLDATVEITSPAMPPGGGPAWETIRERSDGDGFPASPSVSEFAYPSPLAPLDQGATSYAARSFGPGRPVVAALRDLTARIHRDFAYAPQQTDITTTVAEILRLRRGVCQDFAHVMIAGLRGLGLPARYVSGYILTQPPPGAPPRIGADASHAWVSAWCGDEIGWLECDPTNDLLVTDEHVVVAYGRDFSDVTPLRGVILGGGSHTLDVAVTVRDLDRAADESHVAPAALTL
jgi:transglutaminase-like putative cysteine protease